MDAGQLAIGISLYLLTLALAFLAVQGISKYWRTQSHVQAMWASGLGLASGAMAVEALVYFGTVSGPLLQTYVFLSAALVGVLSLGATRVLRSPRLERGYTVYTLAAIGVVAVASYLTPLKPASMVTGGIITGDPPLILLLLSTLVTGPATVVLLGSAAVSLRRSRKWQTLLMIAGALVLGAGGTLYIASFPVALYYAEFIGIVLLFLGIMSLQRMEVTAKSPASLTVGAGHA